MFTRRQLSILLLIFTIELIVHFSFPKPYNLALKPVFLFYVGYIYYQKTSCSRKKDILFVASLLFSMIGEFLFEFRISQMVQVFILIVYLVEHQVYISIFRLENTKFSNFVSKANYKVTVPILLFFFLFYGFLMMPSVPESPFVLTIFYCVQLAIMGTISYLRKVNSQSYKWVIIGMIFLVTCDALTSLNLFVADFYGQYVLIRIIFLASKVMLATGLLYTLNPPEKEYT